MKILKDIKNLIAGMGITGKHLGRHAITIQYPEQKWEMPERSRGIVVLLSDKESGELNCTGCLLCMKACPSAAIFVDAPRDPETKKRNLISFTVDNGLCCFCGLCEEACNFSAIKLATMYEFSEPEREGFIWDMKKLQEVGIDVDYIDTRKKKPVKKVVNPAAAPNPTVDKPATEKPTAEKSPEEVKPAAPPVEPDKPKEDGA
ncbi:MAG: 4Fe-4S binding protein [bacterium]|nr:4Fe-4S binding protein [bacterium]